MKLLHLSTVLLLLFVLRFAGAQPISTGTIILQNDKAKTIISKDIYGQFAEHLGHLVYGGIFVGEKSSIPNTQGIRNDVLKALKDMNIPVLRWPGGCFADTYHWKDGIGPREQRPSIVNIHWGGVTEDNSFGTHEFMTLCELLGCDAYVSGNLGSGTVQEMSEWVEYLTSDAISPMTNLRKINGREKPWKVKYFGVGNESWGCGGDMKPEYYTDLMRRYAAYCRNYGGNHLYKVACGASDFDYNWTDVVMKNSNLKMNGISLHYYTILNDWNHKGSATKFTKDEWFRMLKKTSLMDDLINKHVAIIDKYDPSKKIGLIVDEWGSWYDTEPGTNPGFLYQQNSMRDAMIAAINLNIFNNHADRVPMANIAQIVNVLQAMILTKDDQMVLTPSYYVFKMYKVHQNATLIPLLINCRAYRNGDESIPSISASASQDASGKIHITLANLDPDQSNTLTLNLNLTGNLNVTGDVLTSKEITDYNDFGSATKIAPAKFEQFKLKDSNLQVTLPAKSVVALEIQTK